MLGTTHSFVINFLIQTTFYIHLNAEVYSALVIESTLISYLKPFQLTAPLFKVKYN